MKNQIIEASYKLADGNWVPRVFVVNDLGDQLKSTPLVWVNKRFDEKNGANFYAKFATNFFLARINA